jgi:hypothetical protein
MDYCISILITLTIKNRISGKLGYPVVKFARSGSNRFIERPPANKSGMIPDKGRR